MKIDQALASKYLLFGPFLDPNSFLLHSDHHAAFAVLNSENGPMLLEMLLVRLRNDDGLSMKVTQNHYIQEATCQISACLSLH